MTRMQRGKEVNEPTIKSVDPITVSFQPSISVSILGTAQSPTDSPSNEGKVKVIPEAFRAHDNGVSQKSLKPRSTIPSGISLVEVFGTCQHEIDQTGELIWLETLAISYVGRTLAYPGLRIRPAAREDAEWSSTLILDSRDRVDMAELIFLPRPVVLENSIVMSFVTSIDPASDARLVAPMARGVANSKKNFPEQDAGAEEVDIGFTTIAFELFSGTKIPMRWKSDWLAGLAERHANLQDAEALTLGLRVVSMYVHPLFRYKGVGTLQAKFLASVVRHTTEELIEQKASLDEALSIISEQETVNSLGRTRPSFNIVLSGRSPDARGDNISKHLLEDIFSDFGEDPLSPASSNGGRRLEGLRSLARIAVKYDNPLLRHELRSLVSREFASRRFKKATFDFGSGVRPSWPLVAVFDMVDWASDRN